MRLPGQVGTVEVPEGTGVFEGKSLGDLDDVVGSGLRGEVGDLRGVLGHPLVDALTEGGLGPTCI